VALRLKVAEVKLALKPMLDAPDGARDLPRDESLPATTTLVVEQDPVAHEHPVRLAIVLGDIERVRLGCSVETPRVKQRRLALRRLDDLAEELARARLLELGGRARLANRLEQSHRAEASDLAGVLRDVERDADVGLRAKVVDLVGLHRRDDRAEAR